MDAMQHEDLKQTITRLQNLSDVMRETKIPWGEGSTDMDRGAAMQRRADGMELREALMPISSVDAQIFTQRIEDEL